jgi:hypothetical protein
MTKWDGKEVRCQQTERLGAGGKETLIQLSAIPSLTQSGERCFKSAAHGDRPSETDPSGVEKCGSLSISEERWEIGRSIGFKAKGTRNGKEYDLPLVR